MSRLATAAELLAVAESGGREVTAGALAVARGTVIAMRILSRDSEELRDWREEAQAI